MDSEISVLIDGPQSGISNMEIDQSHLRWADSSDHLVTLVRLYRWDRATVSLGKHQVPERSIDLPWCNKAGIPWVHRPTGGRAVLHDRELTYAVVSNDFRLFPLSDITGTYRVIARILSAALSELGIETRLAQGSTATRRLERGERQLPCFSTASRYELVWKARKIAGSAQRRLRQCFLQHGSIPLEINYELMAHVLGVDPMELHNRMVSLSEAAGHPIQFEDAAQCLAKTFKESLAVLTTDREPG